MPIQAILFDVGGVLSSRVDFQYINKWEAQLNLPPYALTNLVWENDIAKKAVIGQATPAEVWEYIGKELNLSANDLKALQADFFQGYAWNDELLAFISTLRPHYKTGILSDAWINARPALAETINASLFDAILFSAEEGMQKPTPAFYERLLAQLDIQPEEAIFIDDRQHNIDGAEVLGIHGILFTNTTAVLYELAEYMDNDEL